LNALSLGEFLRLCSQAFHQVPQYEHSDRIIKRAMTGFPLNTDLEQVLTKVVLVNSLYRTGIFDVWKIAKHIHDQNIDPKIHDEDITVVDDIRSGHGINKRNLYSFATKYVHWHRPSGFPIYDGLVARLLRDLNSERQFYPEFVLSDLKRYSLLKSVIDELRSKMRLEDLDYKRVDEGLWIHAKHSNGTLPPEIADKVGEAIRSVSA
jgi:hypothetical protein